MRKPKTDPTPSEFTPGVCYFDPAKKVNFDVLADGTRREHGIPEGFAFDKDGALHPVTPPKPAEETETNG